MKFIRSCDMLAIEPKLYYNKNKGYQTIGGGIITYILIIISIGIFGFFSSDIFNTTNPTSLTSTSFISNPNITSINNFYMISPMYQGGGSISNLSKKLRFTFKTHDVDGTRNSNIAVIKEIQAVPCIQTEKFKELNLTNILLANASQYFCIPDNITFDLENKFGTGKFRALELYM